MFICVRQLSCDLHKSKVKIDYIVDREQLSFVVSYETSIGNSVSFINSDHEVMISDAFSLKFSKSHPK